MTEDTQPMQENADRFSQLIPAIDYALYVNRSGSYYMDRVVAFGLTEVGLNPPNPFRSQFGRMVPIIALIETVDGVTTSILREGRGVLMHASSFSNDQDKIAAMKTGKPVGRR
ncbi:MAG: hypothetical protein DDT34_02002 [Firmicutes bacterium]|nr:hypothetical protein [Bacillota bacterium]